jgi:hypothetical protein
LHFLQPLDVGCFGPLKRAYSSEIESFVPCRINHITKEDFLPASKAPFAKANIQQNIRGGFEGAGLLPFDPEAVILKLDIRLRTSSLPPSEMPRWESQILGNLTEVESQTQHVVQGIQRHQDSRGLEKGVKIIALGASILEAELGRLQTANALLTKGKARKRKVLESINTLLVADVLKRKEQLSVAESAASSSWLCCGRFREPGHQIKTCKMALIDVSSDDGHIDAAT